MKSVHLGDLRELLQSPAFSAWWTEYARAKAALGEARARHEDLVGQSETMLVRSEIAQRTAVDAFSRSGDQEDEGTRFGSEAQTLENEALELVGQYEEQRIKASDLWVRLGGAERAAEERREAGGRGGGKEGALRTAERQRQDLKEQYEHEDRKRAMLWERVESTWGIAFERALVAAEHAYVARGTRREAERLFEEAEERRRRAKQLAADAEQAGRDRVEGENRLVALLAAARDRFGCAPGIGFLYWRHADDKRSAFAVALADDPEGTNNPVKALEIYTVGRRRGVALLCPAREGIAPPTDEGDRRFEDLFLGPRHGPGPERDRT